MKLEDAFCEDLYETCSSGPCYYKGNIKGCTVLSLFHPQKCVYINSYLQALEIISS